MQYCISSIPLNDLLCSLFTFTITTSLFSCFKVQTYSYFDSMYTAIEYSNVADIRSINLYIASTK